MHRVTAPRGHLQLDALSFWLRPPLPLPRVKTREAAYGVCMDTSFFALDIDSWDELETILDDHCKAGAAPLRTARALCSKLWYNEGFLIVPCTLGMDWREKNRHFELVIAHYLNIRIRDADGVSPTDRIYAAKVMSRTLWCLGSNGEIVNRKRLS